MPIFFQHQVDESTRLGIWKIEETEDYFKDNVPQHRDVTHPHKRLQHLAGRFLLRFLFPDFPYELIQIADTKKPYLPDEQYHFSISHCGDFAAAIVSKHRRVGIDIEIPVEKILGIQGKFLGEGELGRIDVRRETGDGRRETGDVKSEMSNVKPETLDVRRETGASTASVGTAFPETNLITLLWSSKESVFKWYGEGKVDFREHIQLIRKDTANQIIDCFFVKNQTTLKIHYRELEHIVLAWVVS